jgi:type VI secretion system secreted protein VgrG
MAQLTATTININGKDIAQFTSFTLQQNIFEHHNFTLVCPAESIDGKLGSVFNQSKELIGAPINVRTLAIAGAGRLDFTGVVTQVETARFSGHAGDLIITGYSPTILLDSGPHCKSWEKKALKNIATDCLSHFPQNLLNPKIAPTNGETLSYIVQYKETAWQFLNRMGATYGDWFYYNGKNVVLGTPTGTNVDLVFGSNLSRFNMSLQVRPSNFQMMAYDYLNNEVYDTTPNGIEAKAGLDNFGKHTYSKSQTFFATQPKQWNNNYVTNKKQLDDFTNTRAAAQSSNMVRFNGASGHPGVQLGNTIDVKGNNVFNNADEAYGQFTVIGVTHHTDGQGNYNNDFLAIPASIKAPPVTAFAEPHCETQSAIVTDNHDPKGLGRVRVRFHWMKPSEKTPWIRITSPHGGGDKGHFFIPEIGEEAIVCFEGDNAIKPFVNGTVYHGKAKTDFSNAANDIKRIQTRSGHIIEFDDANGAEKITITDKSNNIIVLDTANSNILISAPETIDINARNINIYARENITTVAGMNISSSAGMNMIESAGLNIVKSAGDSLTQYAVNDYKVAATNITKIASENMEVQAKTIDKTSEKMNVKSSKEDMTINSGKSVEIKSAEKSKLF